MAKKTVASIQKGEGRTYSKVIKVVKSPKTGAYVFQEEMVPNDKVNEVLAKSEFPIHISRGLYLRCSPLSLSYGVVGWGMETSHE